MGRKKMLFIVNPKAGRTTLKSSLIDVVDIFCKSGFDVCVHPTQSQCDAENFVAENGNEYDVIVCAGGDGTLGNTVTGIMKSNLKRPLGYIPCGSTNDYAKSMEIPDRAMEAAKHLVAASPFSVDIGQLNDNYFVYVAAFGVFSDTSYATPQNMKNIFGHAAYVLQGIKSIVNIPTYNLRVEYDGQVAQGEFIYGMISNSVSIGGYKSLVGHGVEFDDGLFEGVLIRKIQNLADLQRIVNSLIVGDVNEKNMVAFRAKHVILDSDEKIAWTVDGEFGGEYNHADIRVYNKAVDLLVDSSGTGWIDEKKEPEAVNENGEAVDEAVKAHSEADVLDGKTRITNI